MKHERKRISMLFFKREGQNWFNIYDSGSQNGITSVKYFTVKFIRVITILFMFLFLVSSLDNVFAQSQFSNMLGITSQKDFISMRSSSADPDWEAGNRDARPIPAGQTLVLAELDGPGCITHIWFTLNPFYKLYGKKLVLKMFWDGEKFPSVEAPINDFFCQGHGMDLNVKSLPFDVSRDGKARNCYFPMPFKKSARIEITNEGDQELKAIYWYIDWQKYNSLPDNTMNFHAKYRQEFPCRSEDGDYLILEADGQGQYVGCNLSVRTREKGWWGEGDDKFYIDGESEPSLKGTGAEDYFCQAWGVREHEGLFYGCTLNERPAEFPRVTVYRFHIPDPVPFSKSLKVTIEHRGIRMRPNGKGFYAERADDFSSVAYWYQAESHKEFAEMPSLDERLYKEEVVRIEGELIASTYTTDGIQPQTMEMSAASNGNILYFNPVDEKSFIEVRFSVPDSAFYDIWMHSVKSWDNGIYQIILDNNSIGGPEDLYGNSILKPFLFGLGKIQLTKGEHVLRFQCKGKNEASRGYSFVLDMIELMPVK